MVVLMINVCFLLGITGLLVALVHLLAVPNSTITNVASITIDAFLVIDVLAVLAVPIIEKTE